MRYPLPALALVSVLLLACGAARAQSSGMAAAASDPTPVGLWQSVSDVDGKPKGLVRIREVGGALIGVVEQILNPEKRNAVCKNCPGERKDKPVLGLTVIERVRRDGDSGVYSGGEILDPDNGNVYRCRLKLVDGGRHLEVRGYLGISLFGRSQIWNRVE